MSSFDDGRFDESRIDEEEAAVVLSSPSPNKKARTKREASSLGPTGGGALEVAPSVSSVERQRRERRTQQRVIVLLDQARLETVKNRRGTFELLNCDDHRDLNKRKNNNSVDSKEFRPDICHQELLALIDSPINKAGRLRVYIKTTRNVLIEVHSAIRIPRTYKRFSGLMVQLLHKLKIKSSDGSTVLMRVVKNPFSQHLPPGTRVYGMSSLGTLYSPIALAQSLPDNDDDTLCFIVGAMAKGHVTIEDHPYMEKMVSVSEYPLSGAAAISRILGGMEHCWGIV